MSENPARSAAAGEIDVSPGPDRAIDVHPASTNSAAHSTKLESVFDLITVTHPHAVPATT